MSNSKKRILKRIYWRIRIILLSLRWVTRFNLGDKVTWKGQTWILIQGVCQPRWDLARDKEVQKDVLETEFRKVRSVSNYWGSFLSGYNFYMTSWFDLWVDDGIKPWMKGCRIWGK